MHGEIKRKLTKTTTMKSRKKYERLKPKENEIKEQKTKLTKIKK